MMSSSFACVNGLKYDVNEKLCLYYDNLQQQLKVCFESSLFVSVCGACRTDTVKRVSSIFCHVCTLEDAEVINEDRRD